MLEPEPITPLPLPQLGDRVEEVISDVTGVVIAITSHLGAAPTGTVQIENCFDAQERCVPGPSYEFPLGRLIVISEGYVAATYDAVLA